MAERPMAAFRAELEQRRLPVIELPSGAGHDAAVLAGAGVPTAMLFVRSLNGGISHSPQGRVRAGGRRTGRRRARRRDRQARRRDRLGTARR